MSVWGTWLEFFGFFLGLCVIIKKKRNIDINARCCRHLDGDNAVQGALPPDAGDPRLDHLEPLALLGLLRRLEAPSHRLSGAREHGACKFKHTVNAHWALSPSIGTGIGANACVWIFTKAPEQGCKEESVHAGRRGCPDQHSRPCTEDLRLL